MKRIILTFNLTLIMFSAQSQTCIGFVPETKNFAVLQHFNICNRVGVYAKCRAGDIVYPGFSCDELVFSTGLSYEFIYATVLIGSSYNHLYNIKNDAPNIDIEKMYKYSIDFGAIARIGESEHFYFWNYNDLLNWYSEIGIGFRFYLKSKSDE